MGTYEIAVLDGIYDEIASFSTSKSSFSQVKGISGSTGLEVCMEFKAIMEELARLSASYAILIDKDSQQIMKFVRDVTETDNAHDSIV